MKRILTISLFLICFAFSYATAAVISFDDLPLGDYGNSLRYRDVIIGTYPESHLLVTSVETDRGYGNEHSPLNKLSVSGEQRLLIEETSFLVHFDNPVQEVNFWLTGTFHDTTINAYDAANGLISTFVQTYPQNGSLAPDGNHWDVYYDRALRLINVEGSSISRLSIQPSAYDGFSIDDLSYNSIPEPASLVLLGLGLLRLVFKKKKTK